MSTFSTIKGTHDILPNESPLWQMIENQIHSIMKQNAYAEIRTPIFENTNLFIRGIGDETDIVTKEMYSWIDQSGNNLTLKPELTAPVVRAYLQHKMHNTNPINRLYYFDTLFRRERPQKGRQRQFYQFGAEAIGSAYPEQDAEIISLAYNIYKSFDLKNVSVQLNSIGNSKIRPNYLNKLRQSLYNYKKELCKICQTRIEKNALRLFDCKNPQCQKILDNNAPLIFNSITKEDHQHFEELIMILKEIKIPFVHNQKLVRGLDYYSHTTFEITSNALGSQDALCGGGRYNNLIEQLGGKKTPAIGFAAGVERLIIALNHQSNYKSDVDIYLVHFGNKVFPIASKIANDLRIKCNKSVALETLRRSFKSQMREADRSGAKITLILGEEELQKNIIIIKDMNSSIQKTVKLSELTKFFKNDN